MQHFSQIAPRVCTLVLFIDIGDAGRHSDGGVFSNSPFGQAMENSELSLPDESNIDGIVTSIPYFLLQMRLSP